MERFRKTCDKIEGTLASWKASKLMAVDGNGFGEVQPVLSSPNGVRGRRGSKFWLKSRLDQTEKEAVEHFENEKLIDQLDTPEVVKRMQRIDQGCEIVKRYNLLRSRCAGLKLRKKQLQDSSKNQSNIDTNFQQQRTCMDSAEEIQKDIASLKSTQAELDDLISRENEDFFHLQSEHSAKKRKLNDVEEALKDLNAAVFFKKPKNASKTCKDRASMQKQIEEARACRDAARDQCNFFEMQASDFERRKSEKCSELCELQQLSQTVKEKQNDRLAPLQAKIQTQEAAIKSLKSAIGRILQKSIKMANDQSLSTRRQQFVKAAVALDILLKGGGEMLLSDWKAKILASSSQPTSFTVIQIVYELVAKKLVAMDRSMAEPRAISVVTL